MNTEKLENFRKLLRSAAYSGDYESLKTYDFDFETWQKGYAWLVNKKAEKTLSRAKELLLKGLAEQFEADLGSPEFDYIFNSDYYYNDLIGDLRKINYYDAEPGDEEYRDHATVMLLAMALQIREYLDDPDWFQGCAEESQEERFKWVAHFQKLEDEYKAMMAGIREKTH